MHNVQARYLQQGLGLIAVPLRYMLLSSASLPAHPIITDILVMVCFMCARAGFHIRSGPSITVDSVQWITSTAGSSCVGCVHSSWPVWSGPPHTDMERSKQTGERE